MTAQEFIIGFDIYGNNIASNQAPGWNNYEKSVFLTKSQEQLCLSLYTGRNAFNTSFDETEELKRALSNLILDAEVTPITNESGSPKGMEKDSQFFSLPEKLWFITYESVILGEGKPCAGIDSLQVVPVTQDEYNKIRKNPFRGANNRRALRLDWQDNKVEIICKYPISSYYLKYLKKPYPIILEELEDGLSINGENTPLSENKVCELDESLHQTILENAVTMALSVWNNK